MNSSTQGVIVSELNPYEKFLDGRPVQEILSATPVTLAGLIEDLGADKSTTPPAPGKWSAAEIVCHLADCEVVFAFRLRQTLAEDNPVIQPFDQEKWAAQYGGISAAQALGVFSAMRGWNLQLLRNAPAEAAARKVTHPRAGHDDIPDHRRDHGRTRPESHFAAQADRGRGWIAGSLAVFYCDTISASSGMTMGLFRSAAARPCSCPASSWSRCLPHRAPRRRCRGQCRCSSRTSRE